jgi:hypothetical protein
MASVFTYLCVTCNTDLGADGAAVESHLAANQTHSVRGVLYDASHAVNTIEGRIITSGNRSYAYDSARAKWLSVIRDHVMFSIPTTGQKNVYMRLWGAVTPSANSMGYLVPYNATITKLIGTRSVATNATMSVRVYGGADLASIAIANNVLSGQDLTINVDVAANTVLSSYLGAAGGGDSYPQLIMEIAWRI